MLTDTSLVCSMPLTTSHCPWAETPSPHGPVRVCSLTSCRPGPSLLEHAQHVLVQESPLRRKAELGRSRVWGRELTGRPTQGSTGTLRSGLFCLLPAPEQAILQHLRQGEDSLCVWGSSRPSLTCAGGRPGGLPHPLPGLHPIPGLYQRVYTSEQTNLPHAPVSVHQHDPVVAY